MCTAVTYKTKEHYFGRTLDYEFSYAESVTVCPRKYPFLFHNIPEMESHYAIIGMAFVQDGYPLYYDGTNEKGLSMAGLNFPGNAYYGRPAEGKENLAPFEFIPYILGKCENVSRAEECLTGINLADISFSKELPPSPLHWLIADKDRAITVEAVREGIRIYDNPVGVLTNNPPFPQQLFSLNNYRNLSVRTPQNSFYEELALDVYSRGMGGIGLPGDLSSNSRFVRAAFTKLNSLSGDGEEESISQFFHILGSVEQQRGCVEVDKNKYEITIYTSCCNTDKGIYYYTTYENPAVTGVDMHKEDLDRENLYVYSLNKKMLITMEN